jgi:NADH:ubiquinone oxidoreductase subunit 6 (subunit J)
VRREEDRPGRGGRALRGVALVLVTLLVLQAGAVLTRWPGVPAAGFDASTKAMAAVLFSPHFLYVFEATSVLILAALVGAIALARKEP